MIGERDWVTLWVQTTPSVCSARYYATFTIPFSGYLRYLPSLSHMWLMLVVKIGLSLWPIAIASNTRSLRPWALGKVVTCDISSATQRRRETSIHYSRQADRTLQHQMKGHNKRGISIKMQLIRWLQRRGRADIWLSAFCSGEPTDISMGPYETSGVPMPRASSAVHPSELGRTCVRQIRYRISILYQ